jgi:hypothetical protein
VFVTLGLFGSPNMAEEDRVSERILLMSVFTILGTIALLLLWVLGEYIGCIYG